MIEVIKTTLMFKIGKVIMLPISLKVISTK